MQTSPGNHLKLNEICLGTLSQTSFAFIGSKANLGIGCLNLNRSPGTSPEVQVIKRKSIHSVADRTDSLAGEITKTMMEAQHLSRNSHSGSKKKDGQAVPQQPQEEKPRKGLSMSPDEKTGAFKVLGHSVSNSENIIRPLNMKGSSPTNLKTQTDISGENSRLAYLQISPAKKSKATGGRNNEVTEGGKGLDSKWPEDMLRIDDLEESVQSEEASGNGSNEVLVTKILKSAGIVNKKAVLMARIYQESVPVVVQGVDIPQLDETMRNEILGSAHQLEKIEELLLAQFHTLVTKGFSISASNQRFIEENFEELYDNYGLNEPSVSKILTILKKLADIDFGNSENDHEKTEKSDHTENNNSKGATQVDTRSKITPSDQPRGHLDKQNSCISQLNAPTPKNIQISAVKSSPCLSRSISPQAKEKNPDPLFSVDPRKTMKFLMQQAMVDFHIDKEKQFFSHIESMDAGNEYPTRSQHDSPAKSTRSTTTKRRKRTSFVTKALQSDLISLKNAKMVETNNFDANLQKGVRPIYIFDDDCMFKVRHLLRTLVLTKAQKATIQEVVYFREDLVISLIREFEYETFNDVYLRRVQAMVEKYSEDRQPKKIKLCFEDTITYLNKVGVLTDQSTIQFSNMFRYSNEDIMAIYEVFIFTRDFSEFIENLGVLQSAKYLEKNLKAKKDFIQGEKTYNLQNSIEPFIFEFFKIYFNLEQRKQLTRFINEANEDLIKFMTQYEGLTKKVSHKFSGYVAFNSQLKHFLEKFKKKKNVKKIGTRMESISNSRHMPEKTEERAKFEKILQSEDFRVGSA